MTHFPVPQAVLECIGVFGFFLYVLNYTLITTRVISSSSPRYFMLNLAASLCVLTGLAVSFNLASALIQLFWVVMSLVGIALHVLRPIKDPASRP